MNKIDTVLSNSLALRILVQLVTISAWAAAVIFSLPFSRDLTIIALMVGLFAECYVTIRLTDPGWFTADEFSV